MQCEGKQSVEEKDALRGRVKFVGVK